MENVFAVVTFPTGDSTLVRLKREELRSGEPLIPGWRVAAKQSLAEAPFDVGGLRVTVWVTVEPDRSASSGRRTLRKQAA
jgi:hypothetical protein